MKSPSDNAVSLHSVSKVFTTDRIETMALAPVSLTIKRGEYLSIAGPSGSGKSTLLSVIGLLDAPTAGSIVIDQQAIADLSETQMRRLRAEYFGYVFQAFHLVDRLTAYENVALPLRAKGVADDVIKERVTEAL